jgi:hypothetical protein
MTYKLISRRPLVRTLALLTAVGVSPTAYALPSYARQTGQNCAACHVNGTWPQLTPWGRFFKLSGYTAGKKPIDKEGVHFVPVGVLGQLGLTWAAQPNDSTGQPVVSPNGSPAAYSFAGDVGTKVTDFLGVFYEYQVSNQFPGWKGSAGPVDIRAVHFFQPGGNELLVGIDSNNSPTQQDVWNSTPSWGYPFYSSPQGPGAPATPIIASLGEQSGGTGVYALLNRQWYAEVSVYRAATGFYRWMSAGNPLQDGEHNYLAGYNPYWRAYWTKESGPHSLMVGAFGIRAKVFANSADRSGPANVFTDYGFDTQYQYLSQANKLTLRGSYIYENQQWNGSFPVDASSTPRGNLKSLNLSAGYGHRERWIFNAAYFSNNGNNNTALFGLTAPSGTQLTSSPNTNGYVLEASRVFTQNLQMILQYKGFLKFNGLTNNIDGLGRNASDNNTIWLTAFFAF